VESFAERLERQRVRQRGQRRLLLEVARNLRREGSFHVGFGDRVRRGERARGFTAERMPERAVRLCRRRQVFSLLRRRDRVRKIDAGLAVDLAGREALTVEQHLEAERVAAGQGRGRGCRLWLRMRGRGGTVLNR